MNIKQAVELLKAKVETEEEKYALALLVCELDDQFCYGWGAGCTASEDTMLDEFRKREDGEGLSLGSIHDIFVEVATSPKIDPFRGAAFPQFDEFEKIRLAGLALFEDEFPF